WVGWIGRAWPALAPDCAGAGGGAGRRIRAGGSGLQPMSLVAVLHALGAGAPLMAAIPTPSATPAQVNFGANVIGFSFLLSLLVWGPAVMALVTAIVPEPRTGQRRTFLGIAFWTNAAALALVIIGYSQLQAYTSGLQFEEKLPWLPSLGINYHLGVDGIGMALLLLNGLGGGWGVVGGGGGRAPLLRRFSACAGRHKGGRVLWVSFLVGVVGGAGPLPGRGFPGGGGRPPPVCRSRAAACLLGAGHRRSDG